MNATKLYIHIGTHKTGSTAIRHALRNTAKDLLKEGMAYLPLPKSFRGLATCRHLEKEQVAKCKKELWRAIDIYKKKGAIIFILTWEELSGEAYSGYANSSAIAENLRAITKGIETYIIVYLRQQDAFIESLYTQAIHEGESLSFNAFRQQFSAEPFNWENLLNSYAVFFGKENIIARRYDKSALPARDSLIIDFARIANSKALEKHSHAPTSNQSYSRDALEIARLVNPTLDKAERKKFRRMLQQTSSNLPAKKYAFLNMENRSVLLANYAESNDRVAKEYFNDPSGSLFPDAGSGCTLPEYPGLTAEAATMILTNALLRQQRALSNSFFWKFEKKLQRQINKLPWSKTKQPTRH